MSPAICALLGMTALTIGLPIAYVGYRVALVLSFRAPANSWTRGNPTHDDPAIITRLQHAHLNCIENLPVFAAIVFAAYATSQLAIVEPLAGIFLGLRLAQSTIHIINTSPLMVFIRANFYLAQIGIIAWWMLKLVHLV